MGAGNDAGQMQRRGSHDEQEEECDGGDRQRRRNSAQAGSGRQTQDQARPAGDAAAATRWRHHRADQQVSRLAGAQRARCNVRCAKEEAGPDDRQREDRRRPAILGNGAAAVRNSTYTDARVLAAARVGTGTTRHFPATEWTINNATGSEPKLPAWAAISNEIIPVELGKLLAGQGTPEQCMATLKQRVDKAAAPFRNR